MMKLFLLLSDPLEVGKRSNLESIVSLRQQYLVDEASTPRPFIVLSPPQLSKPVIVLVIIGNCIYNTWRYLQSFSY